MKKALKELSVLLRKRARLLVMFEILFHLYSSWILFPLSRTFYNACLKKTGIYCFTPNTAVRFFTNPLMLCCLLILFLFFTLSMMLEHFCLIITLYSGYTDRPVRIDRVLRQGFISTVRLLKPRNILLLPLLFLLLPSTQLTVGTGLLRVMHITPSTLLRLLRIPVFAVLVGLYGCALLVYLAFASLSVPVFAMERARASRALKESSWRLRGQRVFHLFSVIIPSLLAFGMVTLITRAFYSCAEFLITGFSGNAALNYNILLVLSTVLSFMRTATLPVAGCGTIVLRYRHTVKRKRYPAALFSAKDGDARVRRINQIACYSLVVVCIVGLWFYETTLRGFLVRHNYLDLVDPLGIYVIAHRGNMPDCDENTLSTFAKAIESGADLIEVDVRLTKDNEVIVQHDDSYKRVFGINRPVDTMTLEQTRLLKSRKTGEAPPTLEEAISLYGTDTRFLIEIKSGKNDPLLVQSVFEILEKYDCLTTCKIQSPSYTILSRFKQLSPETECGLVISFTLGNYVSLKSVDFFTVNEGFIEEDVVERIHLGGKSLYAWTINTAEKADKMIALGVDGIITDCSADIKTRLLTVESPTVEALTLEEQPLNLEEEAQKTDTAES